MEPVEIRFIVKGDIAAEMDKAKRSVLGIDDAARGSAANANKHLGTIGKGGAGIGKTFASGFSSFLNPATLGIGSVSAVLLKLGKDAYTFSKDFNKAMLEVKTISGATQENFDGIGESVLNLSKLPINDTAIGLSKAYYQIVSAGYDGAEGLKVLEVAAKAATGGVTDTLTAADGLTTVMNAWGESVGDVNKISDQMFTTVRLGKTTMAELSSNIAKAAPLAASLGVSYEEIFAATASITKQGTPTAEAFTQMRAALTAMNGVLGDGWAKTMTFQEGLAKVRDMSNGSDAALKKLLGTDEAVLAALALTGEKAAGAAADLDAMKTSAGDADAAFNLMTDDADLLWKQFGNSFKAAMVNVGDGLLDASKGLAKFLTAALTGKDQLGDNFAAIGESVDSFAERMAVLKNEGNGFFGALSGAALKSNKNIQRVVDAEKAEAQKTVDEIAAINAEYQRLQDAGTSPEKLAEFKDNLAERYAAMKEAADKELEQASALSRKRGNMAYMSLGLVNDGGSASRAAKDVKDKADAMSKLVEAVAKLEVKPVEIPVTPVFPNIKEQIVKLNSEISSKKNELTQLRLPTSLATGADIETAEKELVGLNNQLQLLTGQKGKNEIDIKLVPGSIAKLEAELDKLEKKSGTFVDVKLESSNLEAIRLKTKEIEQAWQAVRDERAKALHADDSVVVNKKMVGKTTPALVVDNQPSKQLATMKKLTAEEEKQLKAAKKKYDAEIDGDERRERLIETTNKISNALADSADILHAMANLAGSVDEELGRAVGKVADMASSAASFAGNIASGNVAGAVSSGLNLVMMLNEALKDETVVESIEENVEAINEVNDVLREQYELLLAIGQISPYQFADKEIDRLNAEIDAKLKEIQKHELYIRSNKNKAFVFSVGLKDMTDEDLATFLSDPEKWMRVRGLDPEEWTLDMSEGFLPLYEGINSLLQAKAELQEQMDFKYGFTTESVAESLADGIIKGLKLAENGLGEFTDTFGEFLREMFKKQLVDSIMNAAWMSKYFEELEKALANDGFIDAAESDALMRIMTKGIEDATAKWDALNAGLIAAGVSMDETEKKEEGIKGQIKGITEKTAGALEGTTNSMLFHIVDLGKIQAQQLVALNQIVHNTGYNFHLEEIAQEQLNMRKGIGEMAESLKTIANKTNDGGLSL